MDQKILITLLLSIFIALLGIGIIVPVMPVFATQLGASGFSLGMIIAAFSVSRGVLQPIVGNVSDRFGRKRFLVVGLLVYGCVGLLIPQAVSVAQLILIRGVHGIGSAMIVPIGLAYVSLLSPPGQEGRYMSYFNIAIFCGIGCGPIIGGLCADWFGYASVFYLMAGLSFLAFLLVVLQMPVENPTLPASRPGLLDSLDRMVRDRRTSGILLSRFSTMIVMVPTMAFLPLLMQGKMAASGLEIGLVIACRTLVNAVLQVPMGRLADRYDKLTLLLAGSVCLSLAIMAIPLPGRLSTMLLLYCLLGLGEAVIWPVLGAYASQEGRQRYGHGTMMGVFSLAMSSGVFVGAFLAGYTMDNWSLNAAFQVSGAAVLGLSLLSVMMIRSGDRLRLKEDR